MAPKTKLPIKQVIKMASQREFLLLFSDKIPISHHGFLEISRHKGMIIGITIHFSKGGRYDSQTQSKKGTMKTFLPMLAKSRHQGCEG